METFKKQKIERNDDGEVIGVEYIYDENGMINWRAMIPVKYLYINTDKKKQEKIEKKYGKSIKDIDIIADKVEDTDLVSTLAATKYLLKLRGYSSVDSHIKEAREDYAAVSTTIKFTANYETEGREITYSENACAHFNNTNGFGKLYLLEMATNRSLARCVRSFLGIAVVNAAELGGDTPMEEPAATNSPLANGTPSGALEKKCAEKKIDFEKLKKAVAEFQKELSTDINTWTKWSDIPPKDCYLLLDRINKKEAEVKTAKSVK